MASTGTQAAASRSPGRSSLRKRSPPATEDATPPTSSKRARVCTDVRSGAAASPSTHTGTEVVGGVRLKLLLLRSPCWRVLTSDRAAPCRRLASLLRRLAVILPTGRRRHLHSWWAAREMQGFPPQQQPWPAQLQLVASTHLSRSTRLWLCCTGDCCAQATARATTAWSSARC